MMTAIIAWDSKRGYREKNGRAHMYTVMGKREKRGTVGGGGAFAAQVDILTPTY